MKTQCTLKGLVCVALWGVAGMALAGSGTENDPYTIAEALALSEGTTEYWAQGYIVGGRYDDFDPPYVNDHGISCADTDNEIDVNNCLQVKLENDGGKVTWGLASNPGNFQKLIKFKGFRDAYGGYPSFEGVNNADISEVSPSIQLPEFDANPGPVSATVGVAMAFTVTATGSPAPDLALAGTSATADSYNFTAATGGLSYTPPTNDVGAQTFSFTASNSAGVATQTVTVTVSDALVTLPVFNALGTQSATVELAGSFSVSATGNPVPVLAFQGTTATGSVAFSSSTGELTFTPASGDEGTHTFTFTASNTAGVATQMVDVVVSAVPTIPAPPASVWASDTNSTEFTAAWSASAGATSYRLDVSTSATFSGGGMGGGSWTNDCVVSGGSSYDTRSWTDGNAVPWTAYKARTDETVNSNPSICLQNAAGAYLVSEGIPNGIGNLSFDVQQKYSGSGGELTIYVNGSQVGTFAYGETVQTAAFPDIHVETVTSLVVSNNGAVRSAINNLVWSDYGASAASYVPGYSNRTVAATSQSVNGLTENTDFFFRVRAVNGSETSSNSVVASVTTRPPTSVPPTLDPVSPITVSTGETATVWITARETEGDTVTLFAGSLPANATFTTAIGTGVISNLFSFTPAANQTGQTYAVVFYAGDIHGTNSVTLNLTVASADPWADYYATCYTNGVLKTGNALKTALHDIIDNHTSYTYDGAVNILKDIDECPTNSSMVQLLYLQHGRAKENFGGGSGQWNREHVWANSHGINDNRPAYSDVHHLHPSDVSVNSTRGNLDFDTVAGTPDSYSYNSGAFEPPDAGKGDVARAMFYMAVRYDGSDGVSDLELTNIIPTSLYTPWFGKLDTLLDWNELDPVNDYEIRRNDLIHSAYQKNRNPFVDHPEWARAVFDTNYLALPALTAFSAAANGSDQIDVSFAYTGTGDGVIIVWNSDGSFSNPSGAAPAVGQPFAGGTVLYKGSTSPQSHTGLSSCQTVFYKCWAYSGTDYSAAGMTASATAAGPDAPAFAWANATNITDFTAAWSEVPGASGYRLDVSTNSGFSNVGAGWTLIDEDFVDCSDWTDFGTAIDEVDGHFGAASPCRALVNGNTLTSPGVDYPTQMVFFADASSAGNGQTTTNYYSVDDGGQWMPLGTFTVSSDGGTVTQTLTSIQNLSSSTNVKFRFVSAFSTWYLDDVKVTGGQLEEPSYVAGYSNRPVSGTTSVLVTGLTAGATYYFRVASEPNCAGGYSSVTDVTTHEAQPEDQTLDFPAIGPQVATNVLTLAATASSGLPVSFAVASGPAAIAGGTTLSFTGAGPVSIVASQAGNASWNSAPSATNTFNVSKATAGVTVDGLMQTYDGTPKSATATTVPAGLAVLFTYDGSATAPSAAGSYVVTGMVNEAMYAGEASGTLTITAVLTPFEQWLQDRTLDPQDSRYGPDADADNDGMTTWEEYLADTAPDDANSVLTLVGTYFNALQSGIGTGQMRISFPASTTRYYQLIYSTNLASPTLTNYLGQGVSGMAVTNPASAVWYGTIRALLTEPE